MNKQLCALIALGAGLGLSGCGGGGDGAPVSQKALVPLAVANYDAIAEGAVDSVSSSDSILGTLDGVAPASAAPAGAVSVALLATGRPDALARFAWSQVSHLGVVRARPAAVETQTEACGISGSIQVVADDADNNRKTSAGDVVTVTASNCVPAQGEAAINGGFSVRVRSASLNSQDELVSGALEISFGQFASGGVVFNGSSVLSVSASTRALDFDGLSATSAGQTVVFDFAMTADVGSQTVGVDGLLTVNGSTYALATPTALRFSAGHPAAGTLRVSDGHGNRVDVVMGGSSYTSALYLNGDEAVDASTTHSW